MYRRAAIRWHMCADGEALATAETIKHSVFIFLTAVNTHQRRSNLEEAAYRFSGPRAQKEMQEQGQAGGWSHCIYSQEVLNSLSSCYSDHSPKHGVTPSLWGLLYLLT